jgi:hypothetical protein
MDQGGIPEQLMEPGRYGILLLLCCLLYAPLHAQSLEDLLEQNLQDKGSTEYTKAIFKSSRIINGQSIENPGKNDLLLVIGHRFGTLNSGFYDFFGLDLASTRLGLEYGITDRFSVGTGRSTYQKTFDGFLKFKILRQSTGKKTMPVSMSFFASTDINTLESTDPDIAYTLGNRLSYVTQLLAARKFGPKFSLQLSPIFIHKNLVPRQVDPNNILAMGSGARFKLSSRVTLNAEYHFLLTAQTAEDFNNCLSVGFDIETGGHVFQLHMTNSMSMIERGFISETSGRWLDGDVHFGFNIYRVFGLGNRGRF